MRYLILLCAWLVPPYAEGQPLVERTASLSTLFPAEEAQRLSKIMPADRQVRWKIFAPEAETSGVLIFVHPDPSAEPKAGWLDVLRRRNLIWISAEDFGNAVPSAERVLAAIMGLALVQQTYAVDRERIYIAGMSGGGRIASTAITRFPQLFTGALYIVGADFWTRSEAPLRDQIAAKRYVFLTGDRDFNRREMQRTFRDYRRSGVEHALLMDLAEFGHEYPSPEQFDRALHFLDTGMHMPTDEPHPFAQ